MSSQMKEENMVFFVSEKQQITHAGDIFHLVSKTNLFFSRLCVAHFIESVMIR